jgi:hypothetical protein
MPKKTPTIDLTSGVDDDDGTQAPSSGKGYEPEAVVGAIAEIEPVLPGFEMIDADDVPESTAPTPIKIDDYRADGTTAGQGRPVDAKALDGDILTPLPKIPSQGVVYESRIRVLEAWQYPGNVPKDAPPFIDRNWIGWASYDPLRQKEESPCLRVPIEGRAFTAVVCRPGDFVVRQEVQLGPGLPSDVKIEVWEEEQFVKLFMPVKTLNPTPAGTQGPAGNETKSNPGTKALADAALSSA